MRTIDQIFPNLVGGGGAGPIQDWNFTRTTTALTPNTGTGDANGGSVADNGDGTFSLTPTGPLPEIIPGAGSYTAAILAPSAYDNPDVAWASFIQPAYDAGDNVDTFGLTLAQAASTFSNIAEMLNGLGNTGDYAFMLQAVPLAADAPMQVAACVNGVDSTFTVDATASPGDAVYFGFNRSTGALMVAVNSGAVETVTILDPLDYEGMDLTFGAGLIFNTATPSFTAGTFDFTFNDVGSKEGAYTLGAVTLPGDAEDGKRYKITGNGGLLFGKSVAQNDIIEFTNSTADIVHYPQINLGQFAEKTEINNLSATITGIVGDVTTMDQLLIRDGLENKGVLHIVQLAQDGSSAFDVTNDGRFFMASPGVATSGDLNTAGLTPGDIFVYHHDEVGADRYGKIPLEEGQWVSIPTYDDAFGGSTRLPFYYTSKQELIDTVKAINVNTNWVTGGGTTGLIPSGWIPHPDVLTVSTGGADTWTNQGAVTLGTTVTVDPTLKLQHFQTNGNGEVTLEMDSGTLAPGQSGKIGLTVTGQSSAASIVDWVLPNGEKFTMGAVAGTAAKSHAVINFTVDAQSRVFFTLEGVEEYGTAMTRTYHPVGAQTSFECWNGRRAFALARGTDLADFTVTLPHNPEISPADGLDPRILDVVFVDFGTTNSFTLDTTNVADRVLEGKTIPSNVTAGDVLRFLYVDNKVIFLGTL